MITLLNIFQSLSHKQEYTCLTSTETLRDQGLRLATLCKDSEQILFSATLGTVMRLRALAAPSLSCSQLAGCTSGQFEPQTITSPSQGPLMLKITSQLSIFPLPGTTGWGEGLALFMKCLSPNCILPTVHFKLSLLLYLQDIILLPYYQLSITRCFNYFLVQSILIKSLCKTF